MLGAVTAAFDACSMFLLFVLLLLLNQTLIQSDHTQSFTVSLVYLRLTKTYLILHKKKCRRGSAGNANANVIAFHITQLLVFKSW
jgi:hypothetical protein